MALLSLLALLVAAAPDVYPHNCTYKQGGTGSVTRACAQKLGDAVSAKDFGAVGDGTTSDETAVVSAVTAAGALGLVDLPCPGTYKTTTYGTLACGRQYLATGSGTKARGLAGKLADFVSVKDCGATGDGVTDDTAAVQACINRFTNGTAATAAGSLYFPQGAYKITSMLTYAGGSAYGLRIYGEVGGTGGPNGTKIVWGGAATQTMLLILGGVHVVVENLEFQGSGLVTYAIHMASTNTWNTTLGTAVSPGAATVTPASMAGIAVGTLLNIDSGASIEYVYVTAVTGTTFTATFSKSHTGSAAVGNSAGNHDNLIRRITIGGVAGSTSAAIALGNVTSGGTPQVSEIRIEDCLLDGTPSGEDAIITLSGGNTKNFSVKGGNITNWVRYGINWLLGNGELDVRSLFMGTNAVADIAANGTPALSVTSVESEGSGSFILGPNNTSASNMVVTGCEWYGATALTDDIVIRGSSAITLSGNQFSNERTPSTTLAKIAINSPLISAASPSAIVSMGNWYRNSPAGYAPLYDTSGNALLPAYFNSQPVSAVSLNDIGGPTTANRLKLNNYLTAAAITSQGATFAAQSGVLRAGTTDTAVAFRNNANGGDVPGLAKTAADVVVVGGAAGITTTASTQANLGTPANGTLLYCSDCTIANPCAALGTGALAKRLNGAWVCN